MRKRALVVYQLPGDQVNLKKNCHNIDPFQEEMERLNADQIEQMSFMDGDRNQREEKKQQHSVDELKKSMMMKLRRTVHKKVAIVVDYDAICPKRSRQTLVDLRKSIMQYHDRSSGDKQKSSSRKKVERNKRKRRERQRQMQRIMNRGKKKEWHQNHHRYHRNDSTQVTERSTIITKNSVFHGSNESDDEHKNAFIEIAGVDHVMETVRPQGNGIVHTTLLRINSVFCVEQKGTGMAEEYKSELATQL